ncbi:MAG TPA: DUF1259 domain-containing protein [Candidatus Nitrosocosmicus sp.]|nr:DUF1259 domain-containing protein [Candidatus Nitrosocosmicus sp.]
MKNLNKCLIVGILSISMMIIPSISNVSIYEALSQSQSATIQNKTGADSIQVTKPQVGQQFIFNDKSKPANDPQKCAALAEVVKGKALPDYNLCDVVVYRQAPAIMRHDGLVLNNFSGIGHYIEMVSPALNTTSMYQGNSSSGGGNNNNTTNNTKAAFGEFALIDSEVVPVREVMNKYNWTETALHHHMLGETPKILFLHWSVTGDANELIKQAKEMIEQTSTYQELGPNSKTPSSAGP